MEKIGFGGGCHWCTEAVFQSLIGVVNVEQGWIASHGSNSGLSEGVLVYFEEKEISLSTLVSIHLQTHSSTSTHQQRSKYRSAIYIHGPSQNDTITKILKQLQCDFDKPLITQILPLVRFKTNSTEYLNYYYSDPEKKFCQKYIDPKLKFLLSDYAQHIDGSKLNHIIESTKNEKHSLKD